MKNAPTHASVAVKKAAAFQRKPGAAKDWRLAAGKLRDTKLAREADALGRRYRKQQVKP